MRLRFVSSPWLAWASRRVAVLAPWALSLGATALAEPDSYSDSGVQGPPYQQILDGTADLGRRFPDWVTVVDYGRTTAGKTLRLFRVRAPRSARTVIPADQKSTPPPAVLISGATHGDEYLNIAEDRLGAWLVANRQTSAGVAKFLAAGGAIYVIPIVNPEGYEGHTRGNAAGTDLNRDFDLVPSGEAHFREPETRLLAQWLDRDLAVQGVALKLTVDYHCCDGSLLFPWSYTEDDLPREVLDRFVRIARLMQQDLGTTYQYGATGQVLGYLARGTSKDYYYGKYNALAFTFEGVGKDEPANFPHHTVWWDHLLGQLTDAYRLEAQAAASAAQATKHSRGRASNAPALMPPTQAATGPRTPPQRPPMTASVLAGVR